MSENPDGRREEQLGRAIGARLHRRTDALPTGDLLEGSRSRARGMRRRRRTVTGVAAAAAVAVPLAVLALGPGGAHQVSPAPAPTQGPTTGPSPAPSPTPDSSGPPLRVSLRMDRLHRGPAPGVAHVSGGTLVRADGGRVPLADPSSLKVPNAEVSYVDSAAGVFAWRVLADGHRAYSLDGGTPRQLPKVYAEHDFSSPFPGPDQTVLWGEQTGDAATLNQLQPDGSVSRVSPIAPVTPRAATAHSVWGEGPHGVRRLSLDHPDRGWQPVRGAGADGVRVVAGDPVTDTLVLNGTCARVLDGSSLELRWRSCDWVPTTFSADGEYAVGFDDQGRLGLLDARTGAPLLVADPHSRGTGLDWWGAFDDRGTFTTTVDFAKRPGSQALVSCSVGRRGCWLATAPAPYDGSGGAQDVVVGSGTP